ncbi:MAG TPA: hypothetical protein VFB36_13450 [Nevskiaceae bacterium]|nr:hypothetical protein [Nevskiaceae bacterium]
MKTNLIAVALFAASLAAAAQENADVKSFQAPLPPELTAPTTKNEPLPGPKVVKAGECDRAPEICKARKEELRRKEQACKDDPSNCSDPALRSAKRD